MRLPIARPIGGWRLPSLSGAASSSRSNKASTSCFILVEMGRAFVGHGERLARSLGGDFLDQPHVGKHRQRRIDHARARRIIAPGQLLDRADEVIAVARLVGDQLEQDEPQLARAEHPPPPAAPSPAPAAAAAKAAVARCIAEVEVKTAGPEVHPEPARRGQIRSASPDPGDRRHRGRVRRTHGHVCAS